VMNLLRNALQASPDRGRVRIAARRLDGVIQLSFCDQGPGIPESLREKVFQPYFTTKQSGTGLGLAIVMRNLRQMHGSLELRSPCENGCGTEFLVALPTERN
jgi:signal transduction histidine kinase